MNDPITNQKVTYTIQRDGQFFIIENVPARVSRETGEQFFSPETVEKLHSLILGDGKPSKFIEAPVYEYAA
jgi:hypothetical protein